MDKDFVKTFNTCPVCGSDQQFCREIGKELNERGLARPEWHLSYDVRQGIAIDPVRQNLLPIGISLPGFFIASDICMDCGTIYATEIRRLEGKTQMMPHLDSKQPPAFNQIRKN